MRGPVIPLSSCWPSCGCVVPVAPDSPCSVAPGAAWPREPRGPGSRTAGRPAVGLSCSDSSLLETAPRPHGHLSARCRRSSVLFAPLAAQACPPVRPSRAGPWLPRCHRPQPALPRELQPAASWTPHLGAPGKGGSFTSTAAPSDLLLVAAWAVCVHRPPPRDLGRHRPSLSLRMENQDS